jgi:hypothetical protein
MKRMPIILISLFLYIIFSSTLISQKKREYAPGTVIVKFKSNQQFSKTATKVMSSQLPGLNILFQRYNVIETKPMFDSYNSNQNLRKNLGMDRIYLLHFNSMASMDSIVSELTTLPDVEYAEPDFVGHGAGVMGIDSLMPNDTYFYRQWAFRNTGSNISANSGKAGADIKATYAWAICTGDTNIIVADLDSGFKWDHPDIADRVWINRKEIAGNGIDDDNNGYVDDIHGWNFAYGNNNVSDDYGHGTNVASIIAAKSNNGLGYAGLDWACKIMPLKELDSTDNGYYSWWAAALYYAANNGVRVINMSEGGTSNSQTLKTAIDYAYSHGCFVVAAMMNTNDSTKYYPAAYYDHVVAVGATDSYDRRCNPFFWGGGSNFGSWIDVVAPGNIVYGLNNTSNTNYAWYWGGTSQATPMVAALASLLLAQDSSRNPATIRNIIRATADDTVGLRSEDSFGYDVYYGYGRINCYKALMYSPTGIFSDHLTIPSGWILQQNYPNPFNPTTTINYFVPTKQHIILQVYDLLGRNVAKLVDGVVNSGEHVAIFDASKLASGVYYYRLQAESINNTKKLILLR